MTERVEHDLGRGDPFAAAIRATRMPMIITDPRLDDNPIVFANDAFLTLTGYGREEVVGRNCRLLQGPETDRGSIRLIKEAIHLKRDINIDLLNYRKDGSAFWNALHINPIFSTAGDLQYFFASQLDVTKRQEALAAKTALLHEVDHRVKNNLQMVSALITLQTKAIDDPQVRQSLTTMMQRVEALSTVHRRLYQSEDITRFAIGEFMEDIIVDLVGTTGRDDIAVRLDLEVMTVPAENAAPIALIVNEVVTNALKHAFAGERPGTLSVSVKAAGERFRIEIEDDGPGMPTHGAPTTASFGQGLIRMLGRQLRAVVTWVGAVPSGTRFVIDLPIEQLKPGA